MRLYTLLLATVLVAAPSYAASEESGQQTVAEAAASSSDEDKLICKGKRQPRTGSNMKPGRECRTAADWKEREVAAKRELQKLRDKHQSPGLGLGR